jgi:uncharacterized membrane protein (DUF485 family)
MTDKSNNKNKPPLMMAVVAGALLLLAGFLFSQMGSEVHGPSVLLGMAFGVGMVFSFWTKFRSGT